MLNNGNFKSSIIKLSYLVQNIYLLENGATHTKRSDLHSQSRDIISAPQYMVAFLDAEVDESYVHILHQKMHGERREVKSEVNKQLRC